MTLTRTRALSAGFLLLAAASLGACGSSSFSDTVSEFTSVNPAPETADTAPDAEAAPEAAPLRPEEIFPENGTEAYVSSQFASEGGPDAVRYIASADENVACDLKRKKFVCGVFSYTGGEPYGRGQYSGNHIISSETEEVTDSNELGTAAMYGIHSPDPASAPAPQIVEPGEIVFFDGNYCEGLEDGLMCWNVSTKTGRTIQRDGTDFWTFTF